MCCIFKLYSIAFNQANVVVVVAVAAAAVVIVNGLGSLMCCGLEVL
jgi:hypothetical protein